MAAIITTVGAGLLADRIKGTGSEPKIFAWGTGSGTPAVGDTALFTEAPEARVVGVSSTPGANYTISASMTATGNRTITEIGLFDSASGGILMLHATVGPIVVTTGQMFDFVINIRIT